MDRIYYIDGGMGSLLQARGLKPGELTETWNIEHPEIITEIHKEYLKAGADYITTNTFGANILKYPDNLEEIVTAAVKNAKKAVCENGGNGRIMLDIGPIGKLLKPMGDVEFEDAVEIFAKTVRIGVKAGADVIIVETMSDLYELKAAVLAAKENCELPIFATVAFSDNRRLMTGADAAGVVSLLEGLGVDALGVNCSFGPAQLMDIVKEILKYSSTPVIVNPNAGLPRIEGNKSVYDITTDEFAEYMKEFAKLGACYLGGCCGTTPEYIRKTVEATKDINNTQISPKDYTIVSSFSKSVFLGDKSVIIGERINPTGKSKFKQALRDHDMDYILKEADKQETSGAHILDVNVGLPEIDEVAMLCEVVKELQGQTALPLQLDTTDEKAMEKALRVYNGIAMVNSVNGKNEVMEAIFPLVAKYGGVVVGLTLDEDGIPQTSEERIEIAEKIYKTAEKYNIPRKNIVIDALTMTMATNGEAAKITLDTVKKITQNGGKTVLGVSNISFGLPRRELINAAFYTMALENGLSAGIINPNAEAMRQAYDTYMVLRGYDEGCAEFIERYKDTSGEMPAVRQTGEEMSLTEAIYKGFKDTAYKEAQKLLKTKKPLEVINEDLVPALDKVGKDYETGKAFLPDLMKSAETAKEGFRAIREYLSGNGGDNKKKATVVIATVKGDIHDIGKNIVKALLENYSYEVIDLGKDVPPETVVQAVKENDAPFCGLSALMTTTVPAMEETIKLLRKEKPDCKIMVGGAVLTQEYADMVGADFYGKDAMQTVRYLETICNG